MKKTILPLVMASLISCTSPKDFYKNRINETSKIEVSLETHLKERVGDEPVTSKSTGRGYVIGEYVFTADHITSEYMRRVNLFGNTFHSTIERIEEKTFLDNHYLHPVIEDKESDVAIFDLKKTPILCEKYCNKLSLDDLLTSEDLYQGMKIFWNAYPAEKDGFYRESIITGIGQVEDYSEIGLSDDYLSNSFSINTFFVGGDSGNPIWAEKDGKNYVVGTAHYLLYGMGFVKLMDEYVDAIKEYEKKEKNLEHSISTKK